MQTIKEITTALRAATAHEPWMDTVQQDGRAGVQKAWQQFLKRMEKKAAITTGARCENCI